MSTRESGGPTSVLFQDSAGPREGESPARPQGYAHWIIPAPAKRYSVPVVLGPEEAEGWPIWCPVLPGVASFGSDPEDALSNVTEALRAVLEEYRGQEIPWEEEGEAPAGSEILRIWLDVE